MVLLLVTLLLASCGQAFEDLGSVEKARREYPMIFVPEHVQSIRINGQDCWVFAGQAERFVESESESELWQEAALSARASLFAYLTKDKPEHEVVMEGCSPLYRTKEGKIHTMVLSVPRDKVKVAKKECKDSVAIGGPDAGLALPAPSLPDILPAQPVAAVADNRAESKSVPENAGASGREKELSQPGVQVPAQAKPVEVQKTAKRSPAEKISKYRAQLENDRTNWKVGRRLGVLLSQSGELADASNCLNEAARNALTDTNADDMDRVCCLRDAALVNEKAGQLSRALKYFRMILHI